MSRITGHQQLGSLQACTDSSRLPVMRAACRAHWECCWETRVHSMQGLSQLDQAVMWKCSPAVLPGQPVTSCSSVLAVASCPAPAAFERALHGSYKVSCGAFAAVLFPHSSRTLGPHSRLTACMQPCMQHRALEVHAWALCCRHYDSCRGKPEQPSQAGRLVAAVRCADTHTHESLPHTWHAADVALLGPLYSVVQGDHVLSMQGE